MPYLDKDGLTTLWAKVKNTFALKSHSHTASDLPTATTSARGCVQVGDGLSITSAGVLSATGGGSGAVSGVKGNTESSYRTGNVNLTAANIGAAASSHTHAAGDITSGTIPNTLLRLTAVGQSSETTTNPWYKFASYYMTSKYEDTTITFKVAQGHNDAGKMLGVLTAHVRTTGDSAFDFGQLVWEYANSGVTPAKFVLAYKSVPGSGVYLELWAKCDQSYQGYHFQVLQECCRTVPETKWTLHWAWSAGSASAPTSGYSQITSTLNTLLNPASNVTDLYTNTSGTSGSFTLSSSIANFSVIEVFFKTNDGYMGCQKAYNNYSSSCYLDLTVVHPTSSATASYLKFAQLNISGTSASVANIREIALWSSDHESYSSSNAIKITRVVGWKY